jgi:hypothetical protein
MAIKYKSTFENTQQLNNLNFTQTPITKEFYELIDKKDYINALKIIKNNISKNQQMWAEIAYKSQKI